MNDDPLAPLEPVEDKAMMVPRPKARLRWWYAVAAMLVLGGVVALGVALWREPEKRSSGATPTLDSPALTSAAMPDEPTRTRAPTPGEPTPTVTPTPIKATSTPTPTSSPTIFPGQTTDYIVQQGDTLVSIAESFGVTTQAIALVNQVRPGQVWPGQVLTIPAPDTTSSVPASGVIADPRLGLDSGIGELVVEYPSHLAPGASHIVRVSINVPDLPASAVSDAGTGTTKPPAENPVPPSRGEARNQVHTTWISILPRMRATLASARLRITPVTIETQVVNMYGVNSRTQWMWEIVAQEDAGEASLVLQMSGDQDPLILWQDSIQVEVLAPTPTTEPAPTFTPPPTPAPAATQAPFVLFQSSFDEGFYDYQDTGELTVPKGWVPLWVERDPETPLDQLNRPEYDFKDTHRGHPEVHTGRFAAAVFTVFATHDTALYREFKVEPGRRVRASVWAMGVSHNPAGDTGGLGMRIGIDPTGGIDPAASTVEYSLYWSSHLPDWREREWRKLEVEAFAEADTITVFLASIADWPVDINASHWDDLKIQVE